MAMNREQAMTRNMIKGKLSYAMTLPKEVKGALRDKEIDALNRVKETITWLLRNWDDNTEVLAEHPIPRNKCWCGRKALTVKPYEGKNPYYQGIMMCTTHARDADDTYDLCHSEFQPIPEGIKREEYDNTDNDTGRNTILDSTDNGLVDTNTSTNSRDMLPDF